MSEWAEITATVRERAGDRCEYCRMHQSIQGATFHIEHIVPSSKGGVTSLNNLALACPACNLHKSDRTEVVDIVMNQLTGLFHPRRQDWADHFARRGFRYEGLTSTGRATIDALHLNSERRLLIREVESRIGLFESDDPFGDPGTLN